MCAIRTGGQETKKRESKQWWPIWLHCKRAYIVCNNMTLHPLAPFMSQKVICRLVAQTSPVPQIAWRVSARRVWGNLKIIFLLLLFSYNKETTFRCLFNVLFRFCHSFIVSLPPLPLPFIHCLWWGTPVSFMPIRKSNTILSEMSLKWFWPLEWLLLLPSSSSSSSALLLLLFGVPWPDSDTSPHDACVCVYVRRIAYAFFFINLIAVKY